MLEGGETSEGKLVPLANPELLLEIKQLLERINNYRAIAKERWNERSHSGIDSDIDEQRFDKSFNDCLVCVFCADSMSPMVMIFTK